MRTIILSLLLFSTSIMGFSQLLSIENGSFEFASGLPTTKAEAGLLNNWEVVTINFGNHSPDFYHLGPQPAIFLEEDLTGNQDFTPIPGNQNSESYIGMWNCELIRQKMHKSLEKGKQYRLSLFIRTLPNIYRYNYPSEEPQNEGNAAQGSNADVKIIFSNKSFGYISTQNCTYTAGKKQIINIANINNQDFPPGAWHQIISDPFIADDDFDWITLDRDESQNWYYVLFDDLALSTVCEDGWDQSCEITDKGINPLIKTMSNGRTLLNGQQAPIKFYNLRNVNQVDFNLFNTLGGFMGNISSSCTNGYNDELELYLGSDLNLSVGFYILKATFANTIGSCEQEYKIYYHGNIGTVTNTFAICNPNGVKDPCCVDETNTDDDWYTSSGLKHIIHPISNLYIQNTIVDPNVQIDFKAGNKIEVNQNTTLNGDGVVRLFLEECNQERRTEAKLHSIINNEFSEEMVFEESVDNLGIQIYPNPARGSIFIKNNNNNHKVRIYSSKGVFMFETYLNAYQKQEISTSTLSSGMYLVSFEKENGLIINKKILIYK